MGNLEKILVGIIIVTIVAILGLAIWGLGGHDPAKHGATSPSAALAPPDKEPIPEPAKFPGAVTEIPQEPSTSSPTDFGSMANNIDRLANDPSRAGVSPGATTPASESRASAPLQPRLDPYATPAERARKYTVKKGDTYQKIARAELGDVKKWDAIYNLNKDIPPAKLHPGSMIVLPSQDDLVASRTSAPTPKSSAQDAVKVSASRASADGSLHTVKKGETLYSIAREHFHDGSKWRLIAQANSDKVRGSSEITVGTKLIIPKD